MKVKDMTLIAVFVAFITVCSFIRIPFGTIPFTLQTLGVFVTAGIIGARRGTVSIIVYILLGVIGVPVFGGKGGPGVLAGPTGGYITGFIFTALIIGVTADLIKKYNQGIRYAITIASMILGDAVCFVIGTIQFMKVMDVNFATAIAYCVTPFIIPDLVKIVIATVFVEKIKKYTKVLN